MNKKDLTDLGIAEDVADKIIVLHGKDIEKHKTAAEASKTESDGLKSQLTEANKQIEAFKGMDIDSVKKSADEYKSKFEQAQADAKKQVDQLKFDYALDGALAGAKAKNAKAVRALLNTELLKLADDGSISGLNDQLEKIKTDNDFLFEGDEKTPKIVAGGNNQSIGNLSAFEAAARRGAGLPLTEGK